MGLPRLVSQASPRARTGVSRNVFEIVQGCRRSNVGEARASALQERNDPIHIFLSFGAGGIMGSNTRETSIRMIEEARKNCLTSRLLRARPLRLDPRVFHSLPTVGAKSRIAFTGVDDPLAKGSPLLLRTTRGVRWLSDVSEKHKS